MKICSYFSIHMPSAHLRQNPAIGHGFNAIFQFPVRPGQSMRFNLHKTRKKAQGKDWKAAGFLLRTLEESDNELQAWIPGKA
jgi:hypothetical protein